MTDLQNGAPTADDIWAASSRVHIADLQQAQDVQDVQDAQDAQGSQFSQDAAVSNQYIEASVSLVWPYSSSTRKFALLVAELDARAGLTRRQVKVTFYNGAAKAAQESRVGIGDTIRLSLDGCRRERAQDQVSTPGKRLDFDIEFTRSLKLGVNPGQRSERTVNYQWHECPTPGLSPTVHAVIDLSGKITPFETAEIAIPFSSPSLKKKSHRVSSISFVEASLDPFAEDKDYVHGRSRKRSKFARQSSSWQLLGDSDGDGDNHDVSHGADHEKSDTVESTSTPAPCSQPTLLEAVENALQSSHIPPESVRLTDGTEECQNGLEEAATPPLTKQVDSRPEDLMPPPQWLPQSLPQEARHIELPVSAAEDVITPRLHPLPSPGLPLVSPLVSGFGGADEGFFSFPGVTTVSELDVSAGALTHTLDESVASPALGEPFQLEAGPRTRDNSPTVVETQTTETEHLNTFEPHEIPSTAPQLPDLSRPEAESAKPARDVLDALERFLDMSPTNLEPVRVDQPSSLPRSTTEVSGEEAKEAGDHPGSGSSVASIDKTPDNNRLTPSAEPREIQMNVNSALSDQRLIGDNESVHSGPPSASAEVVDDKSASSAEEQCAVLAVDTEVTGNATANEFVTAPKDDLLTHEGTILDHDLHESDGHYLPTPAQTQEQAQAEAEAQEQDQERGRGRDQGQDQDQDQEQNMYLTRDQLIESSPSIAPPQLSTPSQSQVKIQTPIRTVDGTADAVGQPSDWTDPIENIVSINRNRLAQEGLKLHEDSNQLSSPYFESKKRPIADDELVVTSLTSSPPQKQAVPNVDLEVKSPTWPLSTRPHTPDDAEFVVKSPMLSSSKKQLPQADHGLTTSIAYYTPLAHLHEHFNQLVDTIAISVSDSTAPKQATKGLKDWYTTLRIADSSCNVNAGWAPAAQIFRHAKEVLPSAKRGGAIILRDFKVETRKHKATLVSTESSSWAVFNGSLDERSMVEDPVMSGPPLEHGRGETAYLREMARWWADQGHDLFPGKTDDNATDHVHRPEGKLNSSTPHRSSTLQKQQQQKSPNLHTQEDTVLQSIEEAPKSPARTRQRAHKAEEAKTGGQGPTHAATDKGSTNTNQTCATPGRRRSSRATKTPSRGIGAAANNNNNSSSSRSSNALLSSSPRSHGRRPSHAHIHAHMHSTPRRSTRSSKSPSLVHELRDGKEYVDDNVSGSLKKKRSKGEPKEDEEPGKQEEQEEELLDIHIHELRNGTKYADPENY